jgi:hypothetical protein
MSGTMSRKNFCVLDDHDDTVHTAVRVVVGLFRQLGHKNEYAIDLAAQALQITRRRAWALRYLTQPVRVLREQRRLLLRRAWAEMDRQAAEFRAIADQVERQAEAQRIAEAQLTLPLGNGANDRSNSRLDLTHTSEARRAA